MAQIVKEVEIRCDKCGKSVLLGMLENEDMGWRQNREIMERKFEAGFRTYAGSDFCSGCDLLGERE